ncbi:4-hydroxy-2-oxoglutarate aldolase, mitochondrial-like [Limulus polyphemus]|uniref:4-hydroxy-2-oxoglutarate aldolase, mitochondrial-like n=1 Tax=Limulus polyphemus TaxID=6850 RepID=A0ABM1BJN8_LIMPO|nr:4-hydroxy-2-oxoglutarate aldolase, mitochondrial-like [Limulus polyphemus]
MPNISLTLNYIKYFANVNSRHSLSKFLGMERLMNTVHVNRNYQRKNFSSKVKTLDMAGVFPPITTPFKSNEEISFNDLKDNLEKWKPFPFRGFVIQGSTGEVAYLSEEERVEVVRFARQYITKDKILMAGSGCESTKSTIDMTKKMAEAGADAVLVITPAYFRGRMSENALITHYTKVADESPVPVVLYNATPNTALDLPPEVVIKMASHPNVIGVKDSVGDIAKLSLLVHKTSEQDFQVLAGSAGFLLPALTMGCVGGVLALADALGGPTCELFELYCNGNMTKAKKLQHRLIAPNYAVTKIYGIAGVKKAMDLLGYYGGPTRSPLLPLTNEEEEKLKLYFKDNGFL